MIALETGQWPVFPDYAGYQLLMLNDFTGQSEALVEQALAEGRRVLLLRGDPNQHTGSPGFFAQYWSGGWWGSNYAHLGLVCNPDHAALVAFPNEGHSDWQWYTLFSKTITCPQQ